MKIATLLVTIFFWISAYRKNNSLIVASIDIGKQPNRWSRDITAIGGCGIVLPLRFSLLKSEVL